MTIYVDLADKLLAKLDKLEALFMTWQEYAAKLSTDFDSAATRVNTDIATFGTQVADLKTQVATLTQQLAGTAVPADAAATLDALDAKINALDVPAPVPAPAPVPDQPAPVPATT